MGRTHITNSLEDFSEEIVFKLSSVGKVIDFDKFMKNSNIKKDIAKVKLNNDETFTEILTSKTIAPFTGFFGIPSNRHSVYLYGIVLRTSLNRYVYGVVYDGFELRLYVPKDGNLSKKNEPIFSDISDFNSTNYLDQIIPRLEIKNVNAGDFVSIETPEVFSEIEVNTDKNLIPGHIYFLKELPQSVGYYLGTMWMREYDRYGGPPSKYKQTQFFYITDFYKIDLEKMSNKYIDSNFEITAHDGYITDTSSRKPVYKITRKGNENIDFQGIIERIKKKKTEMLNRSIRGGVYTRERISDSMVAVGDNRSKWAELMSYVTMSSIKPSEEITEIEKIVIY